MNSTRIKRRRFIELLTIGSASLASSCQLFSRKPKSLCLDTPDLQNPDGPLAIDVHAHVFNASDLQIKEFISRVAVHDDGALGELARSFGTILQKLGWKVAPSVQEELEVLKTLSADICTSEEARERFYNARNKQYQATRKEIMEFVPAYRTEVLARMPKEDAQRQSSSQDEIFGLDLALKSLPDTYQKFERGETSSPSMQFSPMEVGLRSAMDFLVEHFQYRVTCTARYFDDFNAHPDRKLKIDLVCPSMVDYDWWLAAGRETEASPLVEQVDLYRELAILSGGRVHAFAPFDPFREAVIQDASLSLVRDAILAKGAIGVKLYPPMGFAAMGNVTQDVWKDKGWLPEPARDPGFGQALDDAMRSLFRWCRDNDVPVMAHTNITNTPHDDFLPLVGPEFWSLALQEFPGLRINFAHFGGAGSKGFDTGQVRMFMELMADGKLGSRAFADASYFTRLLEDPGIVSEGLRTLFDVAEGAVLRNRLMYGSDWKMLLLEKNASDYLRRFEQVMSDLFPAEPRVPRDFFGTNAAEYLGLRQGEETRIRLEQFYADNDVEEPLWMRKVDAMN